MPDKAIWRTTYTQWPRKYRSSVTLIKYEIYEGLIYLELSKINALTITGAVGTFGKLIGQKEYGLAR